MPTDSIRAASHEADELAIPILQVWPEVLAVPVVGALDTARALIMTEALLDQIVATGARVVLIDITGIAVVDSAVARHLAETVAAAQLLGAEVTLLGLGAIVAQTPVSLGLDLGGIATRPTLAQGLALAFDRLGLDVRRRPADRRSRL
jgi:rsbT co-antagonist protein RsbR